MQCKLHTKGGNFKDYVLELDNRNLVLSRPQSSQRPLIVYTLDSFKCTTTVLKVSPLKSEPGKVAYKKALVLGNGGTKKGHRKIYFESEESLFECLKKIREYQGVQDLLSKYDQLCLLGQGSFGKVILAQHKLTL